MIVGACVGGGGHLQRLHGGPAGQRECAGCVLTHAAAATPCPVQVTVGAIPGHVMWSADGRFVYVSCSGDPFNPVYAQVPPNPEGEFDVVTVTRSVINDTTAVGAYLLGHLPACLPARPPACLPACLHGSACMKVPA